MTWWGFLLLGAVSLFAGICIWVIKKEWESLDHFVVELDKAKGEADVLAKRAQELQKSVDDEVQRRVLLAAEAIRQRERDGQLSPVQASSGLNALLNDRLNAQVTARQAAAGLGAYWGTPPPRAPPRSSREWREWSSVPASSFSRLSEYFTEVSSRGVAPVDLQKVEERDMVALADMVGPPLHHPPPRINRIPKEEL